MRESPKVHISFERPALRSSRNELGDFTRRIVGAGLTALGWSFCEVTVLYCSAHAMREFNKRHLDIDKETDVLSFPFTDDVESLRSATTPYLGDVALSLEVCARQAPEHGKSVADEVALLLTHGILHLLGHDHDTPEKKRKMWRETDRLLTLTGEVPRPQIVVAERKSNRG